MLLASCQVCLTSVHNHSDKSYWLRQPGLAWVSSTFHSFVAGQPILTDSGQTEHCQLDHLAIGAKNLHSGVEWFCDLTGLELPSGGSHPRMGTHNHLSSTGNNSFIEIIAVDPAAAAPKRPRWFNLDDPRLSARLQIRPRLLTWVVASSNLDRSIKLAADAGIDVGEAVEQTRGDLRWRLSVRKDGTLAEAGAMPTIIEWPAGKHPANHMRDLGLRIAKIEVAHPQPGRLLAGLRAIGAEHLVTLKPMAESSSENSSPILLAEITLGGSRFRL